ncbi:hypothetical protein LTS10_013036 [Elasticomyces elasticus]|nr:hypothetical protein LTS10_013036 [Elasticomyces elasticus]
MASDQSSDPASFNFKLYRYDPSLGAAIAATAIFAVLTSVHLWLLFKAKTRYFVPFLIGGIFEMLGYAGRIWSHFDQDALGGSIMQAILILVAPALFAASIYMILGRLIRVLHAEHLSLIPIKWITRIFVTGDVIAFTLQVASGGTQSGGSLGMYDLGEKIIIAGLFIQIIVFGFFVATSARFHTRIVKSPTSVSANGRIAWTRHLYVLYATSALILVRSIFRVVEYLQGNDGYLISHEVFIYVMDALLIAAVMAAFAIWYIADLQQNEGTKYSGIGSSGSMRDSSADVELPLKARLGVTQC